MVAVSSNQKLMVDAILIKKELSSVDRSFAISEFKAFLMRDSIAKKYLNSKKINPRSKEFKRIVSAVRSKLRRAHSMFGVGNRSLDYLRFADELSELASLTHLKNVSKKILIAHASSSERVEDYQVFYKWIISKIPKLQTVLDLGAGLHPFSLVYLTKSKLQGMSYTAVDINNSEKELLELLFSKLALFYDGFEGNSKILNLTNSKDIKLLGSLKSVDLSLMLKLTDHLDRGNGHKQTEKVLNAVAASFVLISFPTVTRSGKPMRYPQRKWVELLCKRLEYTVEKFETSNELFYLVQK